jgi:transposase
MLDAVFYVVDNGVKWRALPVDFPVWAHDLLSCATEPWSLPSSVDNR